MKKLFALLMLVVSSLTLAAPGDLEINQYDQFGIGRIQRLMSIPSAGASGILVYDGVTTWPRIATLGTGLSYASGVLSASAGAFNYGAPTARTLSLSTSYQALNTAKAADISISPQCSAALSISGGNTCTLEARVNSATATCSTGTVVATWTNGNTGTLTVGLNTLQTIGAPYALKLPIGYSFILCPLSGSPSLVTVVDQAAG